MDNPVQNILEQELESTVFEFDEGDIVSGIVRTVERSGVIVDFNYKSDGYIANGELGLDEETEKQEVLTEGQKIKAYIDKLETKEGYTLLSRKKYQYTRAWEYLIECVTTKEAVKVSVVSNVQGGLVTSYKGIRGFIPASQVSKENNETLDDYVGQNLEVIVLQADQRRRKVIFSNRINSQFSKKQKSKMIDDLDVGQTKKGKVSSIKDFGVFVDLGGIEGLIHISELSWSRVKHPSDIVSLGEEIDVFILGVDLENEKVSLGLRQLTPDPWVRISETYKVGQVIKGKITRVVAFGAFIEIEENLEGLIHISELSNDHVEKVQEVVTEGQEIEAKIIKVQVDEQKIGLSLKSLKNAEDIESSSSEELKESTEA